MSIFPAPTESLADPVTGPQLPLRFRVPLAAVFGAVLVLAFPPYYWWPLAIVAVGALTLLCRGLRPTRGALVGGAFGITFFLGLLPWLRVIGLDAWIALSLVSAVYLAVLGAGLSVVTRTRWWPVTSALLWVIVEALRERTPFGGFPWGRLAFANSDSTFTGWVAVGGSPLLTFVVALCAGLVAAAFINVRGRRRLAAALAAAALVVAVSGLLIPRPTDGTMVTAAVVQGNVPRTGMDAFGQREAVLQGHVDATLQLAADVAAGKRPQPDLVIWPENASDIDPVLDQHAYDLINHTVATINAPTLVGLVGQTPDGSQLLNSGVVWSPQTGPGETYVKRHPVPFGEYVPFRSILSHFITRFDRVPLDFAAGTKPGVLQVGPATVGDVICFEVAFNGIVRDVVTGGANIISVQTNNATYGGTGQVEQQLALSQLRAVEHGRTVLVAATSGISAIIAPDGQIVERTQEFTQTVLDQPVVLRDDLTLATRLGSLPEWLMVVAGLLALGLAWRRPQQELVP